MSAETAATHVGELTLRRFRAGELEDAAAASVRAHADDCSHCRARLRGLDEEQRRFEEEISFERFGAGVTRAMRQPASTAPRAPRARWLYPAIAMAAMVSLVLVGEPLEKVLFDHGQATGRIKGGAGMDVRIASDSEGPQRSATAEAPEPLGPGERVRIGYQSGDHRYVLAVSVDQEGVVTPLYPEAGQSLPVLSTSADRMEYLPDSLEFTGAGAETVLLVLSDTPLEVREVSEAAERAYEEAGRDVTKLRTLDVGPHAEVFRRTVLKP